MCSIVRFTSYSVLFCCIIRDYILNLDYETKKMVFMRSLFVFILFIALVGCDSTPKETVSPATTAPLPDFSEFADVKEKKKAFFEFLLPLVHEANARIMSERKLIKKWRDGNKLTTAEQKKLELNTESLQTILTSKRLYCYVEFILSLLLLC